mmetsp:Transcript_9918/g.28791  ORF Transcript_9918/g.28791 Transcript_9918/m.28791 type:complete len:486 (-) Transcript_9918:20-1477(-)
MARDRRDDSRREAGRGNRDGERYRNGGREKSRGSRDRRSGRRRDESRGRRGTRRKGSSTSTRSRSRIRRRSPSVTPRRRRRSRDRRRQRRPRPKSSSSSGSDSRASSSASEEGEGQEADSDRGKIVHFAWQRGMLLNSRYKALKLLGDGTFGRVLLAQDTRDAGREVAVKVIRDVKRYAENAKIEADILSDIRKVDPRGTNSRSAIMYDTFSVGKHFCLVFEPCGASLYDFVKNNSFRGFWVQDIQSIAKQSMIALSFLHEQLRLTHTDLKPENILLESMEPARPADFPRLSTWKASTRTRAAAGPYLRPASPNIRLIDFGNATYADEHHSSIINTRQYRGPEVILSAGWNEKSDVWSMGCILMELYTGELLFGTHEDLEHLALMERILRPLPQSLLSAASSEAEQQFLAAGRDGRRRLHWPERASSPASERHVSSQRPLAEQAATAQHKPLVDFVAHLLTMDKTERPSAGQSLRHGFFASAFAD